ncbi:MAG: hypothetical protein HY075_05380 [Deltaproteobacteria bacterium]|nr:hypothetical protein [Deltaproteobacteria bacterium]
MIATDMALGDELGPKRAAGLKALGLIYDPGTDARRGLRSRRAYRNYLHACQHATYLQLEGFAPKLVTGLIPSLFANNGETVNRRALARAGNLNRGFITRTNLVWQERHRKRVVAVLGRGRAPALELSDDPRENFRQYAIAERWFEELGL